MSDLRGSNLGNNPFKTAIHSSIPNAAEIMQYIMDELNNPAITDLRILALRAYFSPKNAPVQALAALQKADLGAKIAATEQVVITVAGTKAALKTWVRGIDAVYPEGSPNYNRLLEGGLTSFYEGSRAKRLIRVKALITAIGTDASLATVKGLVQTFANAFSGTTATQTLGKGAVKTDTKNINILLDAGAEAVWYVYCGLMMVYIATPELALAYLPMELIYKAANEKTYKSLIPAHIIKKICIHTFKTGETVTMTNNRIVPINVGLAFAAKADVLSWYPVLAGTPVTVDPIKLGNLSFKYVMAQNTDLLVSGDITFTINAAPAA